MKLGVLSRLKRRRVATAAELGQKARSMRLEVVAIRAVQGLRSGRHRSRLQGSSVDFSEHRPYHPGDDLRRLDWKAFGRCDRLLVRRFTDETALSLCLLLDASASMAYGDPEKAGQAKDAAAILAALALDQGDTVRIAWGADRLAACEGPYAGRRSLADVCACIDRVPFRGSTRLERLLADLDDHLPRRTLVCLLSDLLCDPGPVAPIVGALVARGHELAVLHVLDPTELELPAGWGRTTLRDPEGAVKDVWIDVHRQADAYRQALAEHLAAWQAVLGAARGDHVLLRTDAPLLDVLAPWIASRRYRSRRGSA